MTPQTKCVNNMMNTILVQNMHHLVFVSHDEGVTMLRYYLLNHIL